MNEEEMKVVEAMETYGGSFVKALAEAFRRADRINFLKLQLAFTAYWVEYTEFANRK